MSIIDIINNDGAVNKYSGLCKKSYFSEKILNKIFNIKDFTAENVIGDQENYNIVTTHVFNVYIIYNNIISADLYIPHIREDRTWIWDIEISIIYIYDCVMYVFELTNNNTTLNLINIYGTDDNADKTLLNLCYVNDIHYIVLNEPD